MWKCTAAVTGGSIDDGDEGEAGEVTVFQAVLRHVEERRMRQHALQEDLRNDLEMPRKVCRGVRPSRQLPAASVTGASSCITDWCAVCATIVPYECHRSKKSMMTSLKTS